MRTLSRFAIGLAIAYLALLAPAHAQVVLLPPVGTPIDTKIYFGMPRDVDPALLTLTQPDAGYTNADGANPGDNLGAVINGALLANPVLDPQRGLEVHNGIIKAGPPVLLHVIDLFTTYTGGIEVVSLVAPAFSTQFVPWDITRITPPPGYAQAFRFTSTRPNQAPLGFSPNGEYVALIQADIVDPTKQSAFEAATFSIRGSVVAVPEPGAIAALGGFAGVGLLVLKRRRRA